MPPPRGESCWTGNCTCPKYGPRMWNAVGRLGYPRLLPFGTKPQLALDMLERAVESGVPFRWVTGDAV